MPSRPSKRSSTTRPSDGTGDLDPDVGLCSICRWARVQTTAKKGRFWRCLRADDDPHYRRYPALPVLTCPGHEEPAGE